jgi:hypothetical protein
MLVDTTSVQVWCVLAAGLMTPRHVHTADVVAVAAPLGCKDHDTASYSACS